MSNASTEPRLPAAHQARRRRLIEPRLQLRFAALVLAVAVIGLIVQCLSLGHELARLGSSLPHDQAQVGAAVPGIVARSVGLSLLLTAPIALLAGIAVTLPVLGPLHRIKGYLQDLAAGRADGPCRIREGDELQELCKTVNAVAERMRTDGAARAPQAGEQADAA